MNKKSSYSSYHENRINNLSTLLLSIKGLINDLKLDKREFPSIYTHKEKDLVSDLEDLEEITLSVIDNYNEEFYTEKPQKSLKRIWTMRDVYELIKNIHVKDTDEAESEAERILTPDLKQFISREKDIPLKDVLLWLAEQIYENN